MTTTVDIRNAIEGKLIAVTGIGKVHKYERFAVQQSKLKEFFQSDTRLLGWTVRRSGFKKTELATALYSMRSNWEVRGYMSLDDEFATELIFDALVDVVQLSLSNDPTFGGISSYVNDYEIKAVLEPVMFCGVLCHGVTLSFDTLHEETATIASALNDFLTFNGQYDVDPLVSTAEHQKWAQEPPNHTTTAPELTDTLNVQE